MIRRLQYIHNIPDCGGIPIMNNNSNSNKQCYAGGQIIKAITEASLSQHNFQFYVGCCIWEDTGLQTEIDKGYWFPMKANINIFNDNINDNNNLWRQLLKPFNLSLSDSVSLSSKSSSKSITAVESLDI